MKTVTFLFSACLLTHGLLSSDSPPFLNLVETVQEIPDGQVWKWRSYGITKWVNLLLRDYEAGLTEERWNMTEPSLDAVNLGPLRMTEERECKQLINLTLTNITVSGLSRPQIENAKTTELQPGRSVKIDGLVRYRNLDTEASFQYEYNNTGSSPRGLRKCVGRLMARMAEIWFRIEIDGLSGGDSKPPELESMKMKLVTKPTVELLTYEVVKPDAVCGFAGPIFTCLKESFRADGPMSFRKRLLARLEAILKRNLRLALALYPAL